MEHEYNRTPVEIQRERIDQAIVECTIRREHLMQEARSIDREISSLIYSRDQMMVPQPSPQLEMDLYERNS